MVESSLIVFSFSSVVVVVVVVIVVVVVVVVVVTVVVAVVISLTTNPTCLHFGAEAVMDIFSSASSEHCDKQLARMLQTY